MNESQPSFNQNSTANSSTMMNDKQADRTGSREITSEVDSFLAGIDDYSKKQKEEEKVPEKKAVCGAKTKDGKPAYYNRGPHNKQGNED